MPAFENTLRVRANALAAVVQSIGLSTTALSQMSQTVTEPSGNNYSRAAPSFGSATTDDPAVLTNDDDIEFPIATGSWGSIVAVAGFTSGGSLYWYDSVGPESIGAGDLVSFPEGDFSISVGNAS